MPKYMRQMLSYIKWFSLFAPQIIKLPGYPCSTLWWNLEMLTAMQGSLTHYSHRMWATGQAQQILRFCVCLFCLLPFLSLLCFVLVVFICLSHIFTRYFPTFTDLIPSLWLSNHVCLWISYTFCTFPINCLLSISLIDLSWIPHIFYVCSYHFLILIYSQMCHYFFFACIIVSWILSKIFFLLPLVFYPFTSQFCKNSHHGFIKIYIIYFTIFVITISRY